MEFAWPPALLEALGRLREGGHRAVLVGGSVRDVLLGRPAHEVFDVGTDRLPGEVLALFPRVEPLGLSHGTVLVLHDGLRLECTTFRREGAYPDARHPEHVEFTTELEADLARRDLTVNAMAFDPAAGRLWDPFEGLADLAASRLRAVGNPLARFHEDALRPVRLARLAATLEMMPEPVTRAAMATVRERAAMVAVERVRAEMERLMTAPRPSVGWNLLRESGLLELWMPELTRGYGVTQNRFHAWDVWDHGLHTCDAAPADKPLVRWAALLHDIGKVDTRVVRDGEATFYGHDQVGAGQADQMLERLRFSNETREGIVHLVREHMFDYRQEWSDAAVRRWLRRVGVENVADLFDLRIADALGNGLRPPLVGGLEALRERVERLLEEQQALQIRDLAVDGADVMRELGVPPGPVVGRVLSELLEEVLENPARNSREFLLRRIAAKRARDAARP
ncbi:MAG: HD domain-containing protein [Candidatus Eisenbacteria bacterium]